MQALLCLAVARLLANTDSVLPVFDPACSPVFLYQPVTLCSAKSHVTHSMCFAVVVLRERDRSLLFHRVSCLLSVPSIVKMRQPTPRTQLLPQRSQLP